MEEMASKYAAEGLKVVKISLEPGRNAKKVKPLYSEMEVRELPTFILFKAILSPKPFELEVER